MGNITVIEWLILLTILTILSAIAIPAYDEIHYGSVNGVSRSNNDLEKAEECIDGVVYLKHTYRAGTALGMGYMSVKYNQYSKEIETC